MNDLGLHIYMNMIKDMQMELQKLVMNSTKFEKMGRVQI
jgi:hypothetical protein